MPGLIPLMLTSSSRTSFIAPSQTKRSSLTAPAPTPALPYTKAEWRKTIGEVKRKYFGKRYRACSARCLEVLDGIKDVSQVEPVYLIYLHFYAATSMEICARPLPSTSALRTSLLQQARTHFDHASALINAAEESVLRKFRPGSVSSSRTSSCHSPSGSVSSRTWTPDTRVSSPTDSVSSFDGFSAKSPQSPPKRAKKVAFSLPKEASLYVTAEPIIRPDSPTLGFEDSFFQPSTSRQDTPEALQPFSKFQEIELPLQTIAEDESEEETIIPDESHTPYQQQQEDYDDTQMAYMIPPSLTRCCEHLSALRAQLARHSASLHQQLDHPTVAAAAAATTPAAPATRPRAGSEEARALDRQARIERLRRSGWQRKRFDPARYEELCESVLAELA
ncbi:hypothetical protein N658DRAFT_417555 [Parathielavia hyrcaniae]|uniref:Uncharacterized protein n=1 Tax=Parathielavia hyrcaniae TaxID=113614 RepID=A0AAN6T5D0_9PEZI|nr:hypothetical protein N658DRAFT_417555 [Parathielavia hyrcaniae]